MAVTGAVVSVIMAVIVAMTMRIRLFMMWHMRVVKVRVSRLL